MSRFGYNDSFSSTKPAQECFKATCDALFLLGCHPVPNEDDTEITGKMGMGWAIRIIGGIIAPAKWFPVRFSADIYDKGDQRKIVISVDENMGFGFLLGMEKRLREYCDDIGSQLVRLIKTRLDLSPEDVVALMPIPMLQYAGFWKRFAAIIIDLIILAIPVIGISFLIMSALAGPLPARPGPKTEVASQVVGGFACIVLWMYFALLESSRYEATFGKQVMGLKVTNMNGHTISFARASGRFWGKWLSILPIYIGFVMAGFTPKKQALHDIIAGTLVIKTSSN